VKIGEWAWSQQHQQICRIIDEQDLWDEKICRVWLPDQNIVVRIKSDLLKPLDDHFAILNPYQIAYIAAAGRVADALTHDLILEPIESSIIPLSHQIQALSRAILNGRVRYLLANPVGLGKTSSPSSLCGSSGCTGYRWS